MLISEAKQTLEDALAAYCRGSYDTLAEAAALQALVCDAPCVLTTGSYHNAKAALAASALNREGEAAFLSYIQHQVDTYSFNDRLEYVNSAILDVLIGVNPAGARLLAKAAERFAPVRKSEAA